MADDVTIERYQPEDGAFVARHIRDADRREIACLGMMRPHVAIRVTVANAVAAFTGKVGGTPVCIFGVNRKVALSDIGVPWLLGTAGIERVPMQFLLESRRYFERMEQVFPQMENWVMAENDKAIGWLKWLGFDMGDPQPFGLAGKDFIRFTRGF